MTYFHQACKCYQEMPGQDDMQLWCDSVRLFSWTYQTRYISNGHQTANTDDSITMKAVLIKVCILNREMNVAELE